jgi:RNA polymerase sigma factor (TIGR02999 family)
VTDLLVRWRNGEPGALDQLVPLVYAELRELARHYLRQERAGHTLQPTALVHEAYLRLARESDAGFNNRIHFLGAAANVMRRVLVDHARRRKAIKRGAGEPVVDLDQSLATGIDANVDLLALDEALDRLAERSPAPARVVELRYFGGLSVAETADLLGVAPITVKRHWAFARVWLYRELSASSVGVSRSSSSKVR